jgi:hypothetical protein
MKKITLYIAFILIQPVFLQAQYSGGDGRGDVSLEKLNIITYSGDTSASVPETTSLQQNYPNPFHSSTSIKYHLAKSTFVKLVVYDITGREIQTLVNESLKPGTYIAPFDGSALNLGVFFYTIILGDYCETKRMVLEK